MFRKLIHTITPRARSFQQLSTNENVPFDESVDSDSLVHNIELRIVEPGSVRRSDNGQIDSNISGTTFIEPLSRGVNTNSVYNSPNEEITNIHSNGNYGEGRNHLGEPIGGPSRVGRNNLAGFSNGNLDYVFRNIKDYKRFSKRLVLALLIGIIATITVITTVAIIFRGDNHAPQPQPQLGVRYTDLQNLLKLRWPLPDINSYKHLDEDFQKLPKELDWKYYTTEKSTGAIDLENKDSSGSENKQDLQAAPTLKPLMNVSIAGQNDDVVQEILLESINYTKNEIEINLLYPEKHSQQSGTYIVESNHGINKTRNEASILAEKGFVMQETYRRFAKRMNLTKEQARQGKILFNRTIPNSWCNPIKEVTCNKFAIYRTFDGTCNNVRKGHTLWGSINLPYRRILFPHYDDGIFTPRKIGKNGTILPNAREISLKVHIDSFEEEKETQPSLMFSTWVQFVYHDLIYTGSSLANNMENVEHQEENVCCTKDKTGNDHDPDCFPITLTSEDPLYAIYNRSCMSYLRSAPNENCQLGPREQYNKISSYLDASNIYGSSKSQSDSLRLKQFGRLKSFHWNDGQELLPVIEDQNDACNQQNKLNNSQYCFKAGDSRVNEIATITSLNTIWLRQHNLISKILQTQNPHWDDEKVFQETRKIVTAQIQHITYNELLPELIPFKLLEASGLALKTRGYYEEYDASIDPTISNVFTTVFKFGHSMLRGSMRMVRDSNKMDESYIQLRKLFMNPFMIWEEGKMDALIRGLSRQPAAKIDTFISEQLTNHLPQTEEASYRMDLIAKEIQLGRDHGIPSYVQWRKLCNLNTVKEFNELKSIVDSENTLERISSAYKNIEDMDLFTGMLAEKPLRGGKVGPTMACILMDQFNRLRQGDRFWYEGNIQMQPFTLAQLKSIRSTTLAKILCDNGDDIMKMQEQSMLKPSTVNTIVSCSKIADFNYAPWKERINAKMTRQMSNNNQQSSNTSDSWEDSFSNNNSSENNSMSTEKPKGILVSFGLGGGGTKSPQNKSLQLVTFQTKKGQINETMSYLTDNGNLSA